MAEDEGNREEEGSGSEPAGEAVTYISLEQARALCIRTANVTPGAYGRRFGRVPMVFEVAFEEETDDHYVITLSFRPQGQFFGTLGLEEFVIGKEGAINARRVLHLPRREGGREIPIIPIFIGVVAAGIVAAIVGIVIAAGGFGGGGTDDLPVVAVTPTDTPAPVSTPAPTPTTLPVAVVAPTSTTAFLPSPVPPPTATRTTA